MRIESCRKCGTEMIPHEESICSSCGDNTQLFCTSCQVLSEEQIHRHSNHILAA